MALCTIKKLYGFEFRILTSKLSCLANQDMYTDIIIVVNLNQVHCTVYIFFILSDVCDTVDGKKRDTVSPVKKHEQVSLNSNQSVSSFASPIQQETLSSSVKPSSISYFTTDDPNVQSISNSSCSFGQSPVSIPQRNSIFGVQRQPMYSSPGVFGNKQFSLFTPTGSRFRSCYGSEGSSADTNNVGRTSVKKGHPSQTGPTIQIAHDASLATVKNTGEIADRPASLSVQGSPTKRKFVECSQPIPAHRVQLSLSDTPTPIVSLSQYKQLV